MDDMEYAAFREKIMALPVWDTHNHLSGSKHLCAQNIWDVVHYFWFRRELTGVGYPGDADELPEDRRAEELVKAFRIARNTAWSRMVRRTLKDLWDVEITDAGSVLAASRKIARTARRPGWAREVCDKIKLAKLTVGKISNNGLHQIDDLCYVMGGYPMPKAERILAAADQKEAAAAEAGKIEAGVKELSGKGMRVIRAAMPAGTSVPEPAETGNSARDVEEYLRHALLRALDERGFHVQVFIGMESPTPGYEPRTKVHRHHPVNDPQRVVRMHDLFDMYAGCTFEIFNAAEGNSMDVVNAARIYPNVYPGGLWWFAFRPSVYRANMQYRGEALPAPRCTLLATDARCIEWAYCKTLLVKELLAEFLYEKIRRGFPEELVMYVASYWLHDSAKHLYRRRPD